MSTTTVQDCPKTYWVRCPSPPASRMAVGWGCSSCAQLWKVTKVNSRSQLIWVTEGTHQPAQIPHLMASYPVLGIEHRPRTSTIDGLHDMWWSVSTCSPAGWPAVASGRQAGGHDLSRFKPPSRNQRKCARPLDSPCVSRRAPGLQRKHRSTEPGAGSAPGRPVAAASPARGMGGWMACTPPRVGYQVLQACRPIPLPGLLRERIVDAWLCR